MDFSLSPPPSICAELGQRLRAHRLAQSMTQSELAARAGVSAGTVKNLERQGQASLDSIIRVALALNLSEDLQALFTFQPTSIAELERVDAAQRRQRAPRRTRAAAKPPGQQVP